MQNAGTRIILDRLSLTAGVPDPLFTSPEEYRYTNCGKRLSLAEPDHLKQQTDTEREVELSTFDLEDDAVMSYCMYIVQQLNLTYLPKSLTEVKDHNNKKRTNKQTLKQKFNSNLAQSALVTLFYCFYCFFLTKVHSFWCFY